MNGGEKTIASVVRDGMCTGCGFCAGICAKAIRMSEREETGLIQPAVLDEACVECGKCRRVGPALTWPDSIGYGVREENIGPFQSVWAVHSADPVLRRAAASGGFVTSAIIYLLESGRITGAVLTGRKADNPLHCEARLVRKPHEALACMGSKYSPVAFDSVIPMIERLPDTERLAIVGLPCHIQGLTMAAALNPRLARAIRYNISLVCGGTPSFHAYDYICRKLHIQRDQIAEFHNRGE